MKKVLLFSLLLFGSVFGDSVTLFNDSPFELTAIVQSANGKVLGQKNLHPGEQSVWSADYDVTQLDVDYSAGSSYTPYTVIWRCSYEGFYSLCSDVAAGANVTANSCRGPRYCKPKPKKKDSNRDNQTSCHSCKDTLYLK